jgi:hypothetical protein
MSIRFPLVSSEMHNATVQPPTFGIATLFISRTGHIPHYMTIRTALPHYLRAWVLRHHNASILVYIAISHKDI